MQNNILGDKQWGFRSLHSTALALIDCTKDWLINIDKGNSNFAVFLDLKKAFDTVDHEILLQKLKFCGIMSNELNVSSQILRIDLNFAELEAISHRLVGFFQVFHRALSLVHCCSLLGIAPTLLHLCGFSMP